MSNKVKIFKNNKDNKIFVQAVSIQKGDEMLLVPSPFGNETMLVNTIEEAINQVEKCGYEYSISENGFSAPTINRSNNNEYDRIIEVLIKNLGHENLEIRNSSINSLAKFDIEVADILIETLRNDNHWLVQQSVLKCIEKIISKNSNSVSIFLPSIIEISESPNTMVKGAALKAIEKICDIKSNIQ